MAAGAGTARSRRHVVAVALALLPGACDGERETAGSTARPSILLVTLDTTRADAVGPEAVGIETPAFDALARRGRRFRQAYATAPETLPSHASMMTGLYPAGHGVRENARPLSRDHELLAERLRQAGYRTAAFVSSFVLARRFGLARGFDVYDDELPAERDERPAADTTERALAWLGDNAGAPSFVWVHYFDPHAPYHPPEPFRSRHEGAPYLGEVAAMDEQMGRLVRAFERQVGAARAVVVVSDHGEGLGDHGESRHGRLLYQSTMHVPLLMVGPGVAPGVSDTPVSTRRVFQTILDWAQLGGSGSLRGEEREVVLGEAMRPFLAYGWQPQVMAVLGRRKAIRACALEVYDVLTDPMEARDLGGEAGLPPEVHAALREYEAPSPEPVAAAESVGEEDRRRLEALGYASTAASPVVREDAPRPVDMTHLFDLLDRASDLFVREEWAPLVPLLERILEKDSRNLDAALRLATAHSSLGRDEEALAAFERAREIAPRSRDVLAYLALHLTRGPDWPRAVPLLEQVIAEEPERLPALEALAINRERQGRVGDAVALLRRIHALREPRAGELVKLGQLAMSLGRTPLALESFEAARARQGEAFAHDLELGVLYLAARRLADARAALDRVPPSHPDYPMALFKRAQVSVLLHEPDASRRIALARQHADETTRRLIETESLFESR